MWKCVRAEETESLESILLDAQSRLIFSQGKTNFAGETTIWLWKQLLYLDYFKGTSEKWWKSVWEDWHFVF